MKFKAWVIEVILSDGTVTYKHKGSSTNVLDYPCLYHIFPSFSYPSEGGIAWLRGERVDVSEINVKQVNVEVTECQ